MGPRPRRLATDDDLSQDNDDPDTEAALDELLAPWLESVAAVEDDDVDDDDVDDSDEAEDDLAEVVPLRRPDEFLCRACFLLKHTSQLADPARNLCRDCA